MSIAFSASDIARLELAAAEASDDADALGSQSLKRSLRGTFVRGSDSTLPSVPRHPMRACGKLTSPVASLASLRSCSKKATAMVDLSGTPSLGGQPNVSTRLVDPLAFASYSSPPR